MPMPVLERSLESRSHRELDQRMELAAREEDDLESGRMSFLEHLDELRKRLIASIAGVAAGCAIGFIFVGRVFEFIMVPLQQMLPDGGKMITTAGPEYFMLYIKVGFVTGLLIAAPWVLWQVWLFVAPGLYAREKRFAIPFVLAASVCFFSGAAFAHYIAFPTIWRFFVDFSTDEFITFMPRVGDVFPLYVRILLSSGVVFQMPILVLALARMGVVTAGLMLRNFKYAVLIIAILGALFSPGGDPTGQLVMGGPMLVLYVLSIGIAWLFQRRPESVAT
jgi:sec-independent protein translocase protein TatC